MKTFKGYIIYNCKFKESDYAEYFLIYINHKLLEKIKDLFDLNEIILLCNL
jgi:hypothetical protein